MKFILSTFIVIFLSSISIAQNTLVLSDTLDITGVKSNDSVYVVNKDSIAVADSLVKSAKKKVNTFISVVGIDDSNNYISRINKNGFHTEDYRNLSDVFSLLAFSFNQDLGAFGQPSEQMFYGLGFGNISYSRDGVLLNNRWQNSYNLNKLSGELIDSLEIAPITKGFLYSTYNNPIAVSMISQSKFLTRPVTHLKFYQASFDEGFVDVLFHIPVTKKIGVGINVSNSAIDSRFANSDYESWKINGFINYQLSDKINISANYFFSYDTLALFGGLDTNIILDENIPNVLYPSNTSGSARYQLTYNNQANIKILANLFPFISSDLIFYFNSNSQKFFQNKKNNFRYLPSFVHTNFHQTLGASFRNIYTRDNIYIEVIANYETTSFTTDVLSSVTKQNIFSLSGNIKFPILNNKYFIPAVFAKISGINNVVNSVSSKYKMSGFGVDVSGAFNSNLSYYAGVSWFQQQAPILEKDYHTWANYFPAKPSENNSAEIGIKFDFESFFGRVSYFNFSSKKHSVPEISQGSSDTLLVNEISIFHNSSFNNSGINININFKIWRLIFSNNFSYYFTTREERLYASPDYNLVGKIHFRSFLFSNNLDLKTGLNYRFTGGQLPFVYDFEKLIQATLELTPLVSYSSLPVSFQLDLFLAATIQERATIFVTLENVLDRDYYIVPYYFKQPITLRFGVSWLMFD